MTNPTTIKEIWQQFNDDGKTSVTYRSFLYWFGKLKLDKENITEETVQKLNDYCTLRNAQIGYLLTNVEKKKELVLEVYRRCKEEKGIKVISGKEFQSLLIGQGFISRTHLYNRAKQVDVVFRTSKNITLGEARKIIIGVK